MTTVQDMLCALRVMTLTRLRAKLLMPLETGNRGAENLASSWRVGGWTCRVDAHMHFLQELENHGLLKIMHVPMVDSKEDIFHGEHPVGHLQEAHQEVCGRG